MQNDPVKTFSIVVDDVDSFPLFSLDGVSVKKGERTR